MKMRSMVAAAALCSSGAVMADTVEFDVEVFATIPSANGLDVYDVGGWASTPKEMVYNRADKTLREVRGPLEMKSGLGAISAHLSYLPILVAGNDNIGLNVSIAGKPLAVGSGATVEVATALEAAAGKRADLVIAADPAGTTGYAPGVYQGTVQMTFESAAPI